MASERRWYKQPWLVVVGVLALGVAVGLVVAQAGRDGTPSTSGSTSSAASGSSQASTAAAGGVDGCLGGPDLSTALITAQQTAPLTSEGLAALARTTARWLLSYPVPADAEQTLTTFTGDPALAAKLLEEIDTKAAELSASGYTSAEVDLGKGGYRLPATEVDGTEGRRASLDILVYRTVQRAGQTEVQRMILSPQYKIIEGRFTYVVQDPAPPDDNPDSSFTPYAEGC